MKPIKVLERIIGEYLADLWMGNPFTIRMTPKEETMKDSQVLHNVECKVQDRKGAICPTLDSWLNVGLSYGIPCLYENKTVYKALLLGRGPWYNAKWKTYKCVYLHVCISIGKGLDGSNPNVTSNIFSLAVKIWVFLSLWIFCVFFPFCKVVIICLINLV